MMPLAAQWGLSHAGVAGLFAIVAELLSIFLVWILIQEIKWDAFFKNPQRPKAKMLQVLLAVVIGHMLAGFILQYWDYTVMLRSFVE